MATEACEQPPPDRAAVERALARGRALFARMRPLGFLVVAVVVIAGFSTAPHPGLSGRSLVLLLALIGFAVTTIGVVIPRRAGWRWQLVGFVVLLLCSGVIVWLQPNGPGFLGCFVAVSAGAMRLPGRAGVAVLVLGLASLSAAGAARWRSPADILLNDIGVLAFYLVARLAQRLREGQEQAMRMVDELDRTRAAEAEAAALAERQRLARDMHDVLAHSLSGLVLQLEGARLLASREGASQELSTAVDRALHLGKAGLEESRRAIAMLRDEELPGPERLPGLVRDFERDTGVPSRLEVVGEERPLSSVARLTLYRVAQEALTNVRKHARAASVVELRLAYEPEGTRLVVEDVADGAAPTAPEGGGYGITGMRERAELLGGWLLAGATAAGWRVELWVPA